MIAKNTLGKTATLGEIAEIIKNTPGIVDVKIDGNENDTKGYIYVETEEGDIFEIYYDGESGEVKIEHIGKVDKESEKDEDGKGHLDSYIKKAPKITATFQEIPARIIANVSIESPRENSKSRTNISRKSNRKRNKNNRLQ